MNKFYLRVIAACLFGFVSKPSSGQISSFQWATTGGASYSTGLDNGNAVVVANSKVFVTGHFSGTATFGSTTLTSNGGTDIFIARYDLSGNFQAAASLGSANDDDARAIAYMYGNLIIGGAYDGNILAYAVTETFSSGSLSAPTNLPGPGSITGFAKDAGNRLNACGYFNNYSTTFYNGATGITLSSSYNVSSFVARMSTYSGNPLVYAAAINPSTEGGENAAEAIVYSWTTGKLYVTGYFTGTTKFSSSASSMTASGTRDAYLVGANYNALAWISTEQCKMGSSSTEGAPHAEEKADIGWGVTADANGVFVTGRSGGSMTFYNTSNSGSISFTASEQCSFLVRYPFNGSSGTAINTPDKARKFYNNTSNGGGEVWSRAITADGSGGVYLTGDARTDAIFEGSASPIGPTSGYWKSGFIAKYNSASTNLDLVGASMIASQTSGDGTYGHGLSYSSCNLYVTGEINNSTTFGNLSVTVPTNHNVDVFVTKLYSDLLITQNFTTCLSAASLPTTVSLSASSGNGGTLSWTGSGGFTGTGSPVTPVISSYGTYSYTVTTTNGNCPGMSGTTYVSISPLATGVANAGPDQTVCCLPASIGANTAVSGLTYSWSPAANVTCASCATTTANATGTYTLTVTDICGNSSTDQVVVALSYPSCCRIGTPSKNEKSLSESDIFIHPNPTTGIFTVQLPSEESFTIRVTDLNGREIVGPMPVLGQTKLDISAQPGGVYIVEIISVNEKHTLQLMKD